MQACAHIGDVRRRTQAEIVGRRCRRLALGLVLAVLSLPWIAAAQSPYSARDRIHPAFGAHGMVATQEATATRVGVAVLEDGGNAVDAAIAVAFALAVTLPQAGNLGGGGFMMVHQAERGETVAIDYRETAPAEAGRDMFLDANGQVDQAAARFSHRSVGVPGTVAGLALAQSRFATRTLAQLVDPAIRLARDGIRVTPELSAAIAAAAPRLRRWPAAAAIFLGADGAGLRAGEVLVQTDLARTLQRIADDGARAFYELDTAAAIAAEMTAGGGLITRADLAGYRVVERAPIRGTYRGYEILSMPPPSSGGVHLVQMLNILEGFPLSEYGAGSVDALHAMAESMKLAYADRARYLGDPDFVRVPAKGLASKRYAEALRRRISATEARPATEIQAGDPMPYESVETTHFAIMDRQGNAVSNTYTLNFNFGTGIVATGTGILLNNEMDDFSAKPGVPNAYGLIGGEANAIAPRKRPLSSMTPTLVLQGGRVVLATGSPGGSRIITTTLQVILNVVDHGMTLAEAVAAPRIHHQWLPDELQVEQGLSPDTLRLLRERGHRIVVQDAMGSAQSVQRTEYGFFGAADPRRAGALALGY